MPFAPTARSILANDVHVRQVHGKCVLSEHGVGQYSMNKERWNPRQEHVVEVDRIADVLSAGDKLEVCVR